MEVITIDGQDFVKASAAARQAGYTSDYVGQLARAGAIPARLIGRSWYVDAAVLRTHRVEKKRFSREKAREQVKKAIKEKEAEKTSSQALEASKSASVRLPVYDRDEYDLIPVIEKTVATPQVEAVVVSESKQDQKGEYTPLTVTVLPSHPKPLDEEIRSVHHPEEYKEVAVTKSTSHRQVIAPRKKKPGFAAAVLGVESEKPLSPAKVSPITKSHPAVNPKPVVTALPSKNMPWGSFTAFFLSIGVAFILATLEIHTLYISEHGQKNTGTEYVINIGALRSVLLD